MGVRSSEIGTKADPMETGVIDESTVAHWGVWFVRGLVVALIAYTVFGSFVPFAGGWAALSTAWAAGNWERLGWAVGWTLVFQGMLTAGQWGSKTQIVWWWRRWKFLLERESFTRGTEADRYALLAEQAQQRIVGWVLLYALLLLVSSAPSTYTYVTWLDALIEEWFWLAVAVIFLLSIIGDIIPEWVMVRRPVAAAAAPPARQASEDDEEEE